MPFSHLQQVMDPVLNNDAYLQAFVLENQTDMVFVKDENSRIVYANNAFRAVYAPEERDHIIGHTTFEKFAPEEAQLFYNEDRRAFREGRSEMIEDVTTWDGRKIVLLTRKLVVELKDGEKRLVCVGTNITELAERKDRLVALNAKLKHYSHSIAHDFKNPMSSLIAGLGIIERDEETQLGRRAKVVIEAMRDSLFGLAQFVDSLLLDAASAISKPEFEEYDLNLLLREVHFNLSAELNRSSATLNVARLPNMIVEPNLLRQVFQNLIENAIKYSEAERLLITVNHELQDGMHVFRICDNGKGIPERIRARVFDEMFTGGDQQGLGLGLSLCQRVAHLHGGRMEIDNSYDSGCSILLYLPDQVGPKDREMIWQEKAAEIAPAATAPTSQPVKSPSPVG